MSFETEALQKQTLVVIIIILGVQSAPLVISTIK